LSQQLDRFVSAARQRDWSTAFQNANGLNMDEMLRGMASLGVLLGEMRIAGDTYGRAIRRHTFGRSWRRSMRVG
jgi:hypothetical protein